jgi:FtsP/CotA-like multicopper oxidase with cupredoxin domain
MAEIELTAAPGQTQILPGTPTGVLHYTGQVLSGPPSVLESIRDSYLGPIIRLTRGDRVRIRSRNEIGGPSIVHWHGLLVPETGVSSTYRSRPGCRCRPRLPRPARRAPGEPW